MRHTATNLTLPGGPCRLEVFDWENNTQPSIVVSAGPPNPTPYVRIQSECFTGHVLDAQSCDCRGQLELSLRKIHDRGGILIYLRQEGRGIGLFSKVESYILQKQGLDTVDANKRLGFEVDPRTYEEAAEILKILGLHEIYLLTNNPKKVKSLQEMGIRIKGTIAVPPDIKPTNIAYLTTKKERMGHDFTLQ